MGHGTRDVLQKERGLAAFLILDERAKLHPCTFTHAAVIDRRMVGGMVTENNDADYLVFPDFCFIFAHQQKEDDYGKRCQVSVYGR